MTLLEAIQRDIEEAPTIMGLSAEQEFCRRLMEIPEADLLEQCERVEIILGRLHDVIINAVEAMEEDRGVLSISLDTDKNYHVVKIRDNGSGIAEENLSKLFEPYFTSKRNGLGLGLAATLNILQSHKGRIEVTSEMNKGSQFIITVPAAQDMA